MYRSYSKRNELVPSLFVKLWMYQLLRALSYLHSIGGACLCPRPSLLLVQRADSRASRAQSVTATSSRTTSCATPPRAGSSSSTLARQRCSAAPTSRTRARGSTAHLSSCSARRCTQVRLERLSRSSQSPALEQTLTSSEERAQSQSVRSYDVQSALHREMRLREGATDPLLRTDLWSSGCVLAELLAGKTFFVGQDGASTSLTFVSTSGTRLTRSRRAAVGQLVEIIQVLGTPTRREVLAMHPSYAEQDFTIVEPVPLCSVRLCSTDLGEVSAANALAVAAPPARLARSARPPRLGPRLHAFLPASCHRGHVPSILRRAAPRQRAPVERERERHERVGPAGQEVGTRHARRPDRHGASVRLFDARCVVGRLARSNPSALAARCSSPACAPG